LIIFTWLSFKTHFASYHQFLLRHEHTLHTLQYQLQPQTTAKHIEIAPCMEGNMPRVFTVLFSIRNGWRQSLTFLFCTVQLVINTLLT